MVHFILKFKKILFWKKIHFGLVFVLTPTNWTSDCLLKVLFKCFNGRQIWIFGAKETCNPQDCSHSVFASACEFSTLLSHSVLMMAHLNILTMFQTTGKIVYFSNKNGLTWQWQHCHFTNRWLDSNKVFLFVSTSHQWYTDSSSISLGGQKMLL